MKTVSVIVPVYNVEKYLSRCLDSLVNQSLKDIEIIVVNDGSPDNSQKIIEDYQKRYPQIIRGYKKQNGGLSDARNYGIKQAEGEYLVFIDSDDYVETNMLEVMYKKAKENNFDVIACDIKYIYEDTGDSRVISSNIKKDILDKNEIKKLLLNIYPSACNKMYKRNLFKNNFEFKKGILFEDVEFTHRLIPKIESIGIVNQALVNYVQRDGTITKTADKRILGYIDNMNGIIDYYKKNNYYEEYKAELEYSYVRYLYATFIKQATLLNKEDYNIAVNDAISNRKKTFPKYRQNKYFYQTGIKGIYLLVFNRFIAKLLYLIKH